MYSSFSHAVHTRFNGLTRRHWLLASCGFSFILLTVRLLATERPEFIFLGWNLFLGALPYLLTDKLQRSPRLLESRWWLLCGGVAWLLLIPNSFYIITDLFHLGKSKAAPRWFDLLLVFSFAWNGVVLGILSIRQVELIARVVAGRPVSFVVILVVMWLVALGVYIGRFLRFNSWDVLTNPLSLAGAIGEMVIDPFQHAYAWAMTVCYGLFMTLLYYTVKMMGTDRG